MGEVNKPVRKHSRDRVQGKPDGSGQPASPEWADGLKRLYDSVIEEPLPDSFKDLLARLDDDES